MLDMRLKAQGEWSARLGETRICDVGYGVWGMGSESWGCAVMGCKGSSVAEAKRIELYVLPL